MKKLRPLSLVAAMLIAGGSYRWQLAERLQTVEQSSMPDKWKTLYREAVDFKRTPHRTQKPDMKAFWSNARDFFRWAVSCCAGEEGESAQWNFQAMPSMRRIVFQELREILHQNPFAAAGGLAPSHHAGGGGDGAGGLPCPAEYAGKTGQAE